VTAGSGAAPAPARTPSHFADRALRAMRRAGSPVCVGLDPVLERLPESVAPDEPPPARLERFCLETLDACAQRVGVAKVQSACFERYAAPGLDAMARVIAGARERGYVTILDAKRGDVGVTARHYAAFAFDAMDADALTVSAYLGPDSLEAYLERSDELARGGEGGRGLFVLVRTSNPGSDAVQSRLFEDRSTAAQAMARLVAGVGAGRAGEAGVSDVGAVVAATKPQDAAPLRRILSDALLLVPGYGAQGGGAESVRDLLAPGDARAIVTASRSVIYAFEGASGAWTDAVRDAAARFSDDVRVVAGW